MHHDTDLRMTYMESMHSLLQYSDDPRHNEIVRRLFSNIKSEANFPNPGKESLTINLLIEMAEVPEEAEELMALCIIQNLLTWQWGLQAFFVNTRAADYLLKRTPKTQALIVKQFKVIETANEMSKKYAGVVDQATQTRILEYLNGGVYGENVVNPDPYVATKEGS